MHLNINGIFQKYFTLICISLFLFGCSSAPQKNNQASTPKSSIAKSTQTKPGIKLESSPQLSLPKANSGQGGYYEDDGPGENVPVNLEEIIDPIPVVEPYSRSGNKPYTVFGKTYTPITDTNSPFNQKGYATWYGKKFHGKRTSSGEKYDMYKVTAAHPILPIPSYARITNLGNGKQIIVRINDRGPFHSSRVIDLSYTAALKLGFLNQGKAEVEVERLLPEEIRKMEENRGNIEDGVRAKQVWQEQEKSMQSEQTERINNENKFEQMTAKQIYLQFGAFGLKENAIVSIRELEKAMRETLNNKKLEIYQNGALYRIQSGPYVSRELANSDADKFSLGGVRPIIVVR